MPVLDILESDGSLSLFAPAMVSAVEMYPDKPEKRDELLVWIGIQGIIEGAGKKKTVQVPVPWLQVLLRSAPADQLVQDLTAYAAKSWIAAELIMFTTAAAIHHRELDVTMTKAIWVLSRLFHGQKTWGGDSIVVAERTAWSAWIRFKSVAHFHAIRSMWLQRRTPETGADIEGLATMQLDKLLEYLALAEQIRTMAVERKIVSHEETWYPPKSLALPQISVKVPPLPQTALDQLAKYKPEHSRNQ